MPRSSEVIHKWKSCPSSNQSIIVTWIALEIAMKTLHTFCDSHWHWLCDAWTLTIPSFIKTNERTRIGKTQLRMIFSKSLYKALTKNPLVFNAITGGVMCGCSDVLAQDLEKRRLHKEQDDDTRHIGDTTNKSHTDISATSTQEERLPTIDWKRCVCAVGIGTFFGGVVYPYAYARLDSIWVGTKFRTVLQKSLVEIATVGIFVNSISMTSRGLLRGDKSLFEVLLHVSDELPTVTRNDFFVWLPYNLLAFSVIPATLRPTSTLAMEASWQTYISWRSHDFPQLEMPPTTMQLNED